MDWIQIMSIMGGFIGGGGLTALFTLKFSRKKAGADADNAAITALNNAITTMTGIDSSKDDEIADLKAENTELRQQIGKLQAHLADKRCECTTKGYYMCVHQGCSLRRPALGRGKTFFDEHKDEVDFGADFYTVEELMRAYKAQEADRIKMIGYEDAAEANRETR